MVNRPEKNPQYRKLLVLLSKKPDLEKKIDPYILHTLSSRADRGENVDEFSVPMVLEVEGGAEKLKPIESLYIATRIGSIVCVKATIEQLIQLAQMPEVKDLEASRPASTSE